MSQSNAGRPSRKETPQGLLTSEMVRTVKLARLARKLLQRRLEKIDDLLGDPTVMREQGAELSEELIEIMSALDRTANEAAKLVVPKGVPGPDDSIATAEDVLAELQKEKRTR